MTQHGQNHSMAGSIKGKAASMDAALDTTFDAAFDAARGYDSMAALDAASAADYFTLLKPRVMSLVIFTALIGMIMAPIPMHPVLAFTALLLISIGAGAAGALNMWYDADIDAHMRRTQSRPIPSGRIDRNAALNFGFWLAAISVFCLGLFINWLAAGLLAFTIFFYVVIYTIWLKRLTPQNIVIGGAAGAFPPVIGWAAAMGDISLYPLLLFAIIFFWTPPHFWALAILKKKEYADIGIPMLPVTAGVLHTKWQICIYTCVMVGASLAPYGLGFAGLFYALSAMVLGGGFMLLALWVLLADGAHLRRACGILFAYSIIYLFALFAALPADKLLAAGSI